MFTPSSAAGVVLPKLSVEHVRKSFRQANGADVAVIADLSFTVRAGGHVAIVG